MFTRKPRQKSPTEMTEAELQAEFATPAQIANGHSWVCDCPRCAGDGGESQFHRLGEPHWCSDVWWPGFGPRANPVAPQRLWGH